MDGVTPDSEALKEAMLLQKIQNVNVVTYGKDDRSFLYGLAPFLTSLHVIATPFCYKHHSEVDCYCGKTKDYIWIITEFCDGGDLQQKLNGAKGARQLTVNVFPAFPSSTSDRRFSLPPSTQSYRRP
jgi:hypothetical protein